jgi:hypothetical protein
MPQEVEVFKTSVDYLIMEDLVEDLLEYLVLAVVVLVDLVGIVLHF